MAPVAMRLLGDRFNERLSKPGKEFRFGSNGSIKVDIDPASDRYGTFHDYEAELGGGVIDLVKHKRGVDHPGAVSWLRTQGFLNGSPTSAGAAAVGTPMTAPAITMEPSRIVAEYDYTDEGGSLLFQVVRFEPKEFRQRKRGANGEWVWKLDRARKVLYRLPELIAAVKRGDVVFVVEGEKDVESLIRLGLVATTCPGGAGKWRPEFTEFLRDADAIVIGDSDNAGRDHVAQVAAFLANVAKQVRVLDIAKAWPECPDKGDVSDWIAAGGNADKLRALVNRTAKPEPPPQEWPEPKALPNELAPVTAFDTKVLPERLASWVTDISERLQCPIDYVAVSALTALGAIVGRRIGIKPQQKTDWLEVPNIWGVFVGRPGMLKSPAMNEALKPLHLLEAEEAENYKVAQEAYLAGMSAYKLKKDVRNALEKEHLRKTKGAPDAKDDKGNLIKFSFDLGEEPKEPTAVRYRTNDTSYEKLGELLVENPTGMLVERDELISLLKHLDKDDEAVARGFYLSGWSGLQSYTFDRITRGTLHIDGVCISILGNTQPSRIAEYVRRANADGGGGDGLLQRFGLMVWPDIPDKWEDIDRFPDATARSMAHKVFKEASEIDISRALQLGATKGQYDTIPFLRFDEGAHDDFLSWHTDLEARLRGGELSRALEGHLAKYRKLVPALALINHIADGGIGPVTQVALLRAIAAAEYLESHARRLYGSHNTIEVTAAKAILKHIRRKDLAHNDKGELIPFTAREVQRHDWSGLTDGGHIQLGLSLLVELDHLASTEVGAGQRGGRPTVAYDVNPKVMK
jgi:putative DNA primase/helicase